MILFPPIKWENDNYHHLIGTDGILSSISHSYIIDWVKLVIQILIVSIIFFGIFYFRKGKKSKLKSKNSNIYISEKGKDQDISVNPQVSRNFKYGKIIIAIILILFIIFLVFRKKSFDQYSYSEIELNYDNSNLVFTELESDIRVRDKWMNGKPAGRLYVIFAMKNKGNKSIELNSEDFKVYLPSEKEYYNSNLNRSYDDREDNDLWESQENIIMPGKVAKFDLTYWLPYSNDQQFYKNIEWQISNKNSSNIIVKLKPTFDKYF